MSGRRATQEGGFLYIEVLAALVILAFVLVSAAPSFILAARQNAAASDLTFATTMAHDMAESLKRTPYAALTGGSDSAVLHSVRYARSWVVANDTPQPGMRTVTVTVVPGRQNPFGANRVATVRFYRAP